MKLFHTPKTKVFYPDSQDEDHPDGMEVEIGDDVEWEQSTDWGIASYDGEITEILPRKEIGRASCRERVCLAV